MNLSASRSRCRLPDFGRWQSVDDDKVVSRQRDATRLVFSLATAMSLLDIPISLICRGKRRCTVDTTKQLLMRKIWLSSATARSIYRHLKCYFRSAVKNLRVFWWLCGLWWYWYPHCSAIGWYYYRIVVIDNAGVQYISTSFVWGKEMSMTSKKSTVTRARQLMHVFCPLMLT